MAFRCVRPPSTVLLSLATLCTPIERAPMRGFTIRGNVAFFKSIQVFFEARLRVRETVLLEELHSLPFVVSDAHCAHMAHHHDGTRFHFYLLCVLREDFEFYVSSANSSCTFSFLQISMMRGMWTIRDTWALGTASAV